MNFISWADFEKIDIRVGTVTIVNEFPKAKKPAYQLTIDLGELGTRMSSAQITELYLKNDLVGKQVIVVINLAPKKIADFISECLVLGIYSDQNAVVLLHPERKVTNGQKIG
jgi:tRNA-binding protein